MNDSSRTPNPGGREPDPTVWILHGRYEIVRRLGKGNMATVDLAWDKDLDRKVAIKSPIPELLFDDESMLRFRNEAQALAAFTKPKNIAQVYDYFKEIDPRTGRETPYIVTEYIEGRSLADIIRKPPDQGLAVDWVLTVVSQVLEALEVVHGGGKRGTPIIHRDVKPSNIMIEDSTQEAQLIDFGIVRSEGSRLTRPGFFVATTEYASPEQLRGEDLDVRTDLYSTSCVLFEALSGQLPFAADTYQARARGFHTDVPPLPRLDGLPPDVHSAIERVIRGGLQSDREDRWSSAQEMRAKIDAARARLSGSPGRGLAAGTHGGHGAVTAESAPTAISSQASPSASNEARVAPTVFAPSPTDHAGDEAKAPAVKEAAVVSRGSSGASAPPSGARRAQPTLAVTIEKVEIGGDPAPGKVLEAEVVGLHPPDAELHYRWIRRTGDIAYATSKTYVLTDRDIGAGRGVAVRVTARAKGYLPRVEESRYVDLGRIQIGEVSIEGEARGGETLTAHANRVEPGSAALTYQWYLDGEPIPGATRSEYLVAPADAADAARIYVDVTATAPGYAPVTASSAAMLATMGTAKLRSVQVVGRLGLGRQLTAKVGTVEPADAVLTYQWYRKNTPVPGETSRTYTLTRDDEGPDVGVWVKVAAAAPGYETARRKSPSVHLLLAHIGGVVIDGEAVPGATLTARAVKAGPPRAGVGIEYQWLRGKSPIPGATEQTYVVDGGDAMKGALLSVRAIVRGADHVPARATSKAVTAHFPTASPSAEPVPVVRNRTQDPLPASAPTPQPAAPSDPAPKHRRTSAPADRPQPKNRPMPEATPRPQPTPKSSPAEAKPAEPSYRIDYEPKWLKWITDGTTVRGTFFKTLLALDATLVLGMMTWSRSLDLPKDFYERLPLSPTLPGWACFVGALVLWAITYLAYNDQWTRFPPDRDTSVAPIVFLSLLSHLTAASIVATALAGDLSTSPACRTSVALVLALFITSSVAWGCVCGAVRRSCRFELEWRQRVNDKTGAQRHLLVKPFLAPAGFAKYRRWGPRLILVLAVELAPLAPHCASRYGVFPGAPEWLLIGAPVVSILAFLFGVDGFGDDDELRFPAEFFARRNAGGALVHYRATSWLTVGAMTGAWSGVRLGVPFAVLVAVEGLLAGVLLSAAFNRTIYSRTSSSVRRAIQTS